MSEIKLYDTVNIAGHYLSALINDDYSGLSDEEKTEFDEWYKEYMPSGGTFVFEVISEEPEFSEDIITGLMADTYTVNIFEL